MMTERSLDYLVGLPYKIEILANEDGTGYYAEIPVLRGCLAYAATPEEALDILEEIKLAWMEEALESGWPIPAPEDTSLREYSGRFNTRLPRYLHRDLVGLAERNGTSLNQLVVALLSEGAERRRLMALERVQQPLDYFLASVSKTMGREWLKFYSYVQDRPAFSSSLFHRGIVHYESSPPTEWPRVFIGGIDD